MDENMIKIIIKIDVKLIIVINGYFVNFDLDIKDIDLDKISSINVLKSFDVKVKYGDVGNNMVIEIIIKMKIGLNELEELQGKIVKGIEIK